MKKLTIILSLLIISVSCGEQAFKADNELYPGFWVGEETSHFYELDIPSSNTEGTWNQILAVVFLEENTLLKFS
jgi:hypothetical protein